MGSIFRRRWCFMSTCHCLPQLKFEQRSSTLLLACGASLFSIFNVSCIGHLMSHGTPPLHASLFSVALQRRRPYILVVVAPSPSDCALPVCSVVC